MFQREIFILAHNLGDRSFYSKYETVEKNQWRPYDERKIQQEKQLRCLIAYSFNQVPYYRSLFKELALRPEDIKTIEDLEKLPVLTKEIIRANWDALKPANLSSMAYSSRATGGSTGTPMKYRLSSHDRFLGGALLYRGWGFGGYDLGDKMVFLAGSSLGVKTQHPIVTKVHELVRNVRKFSSYEMGEAEMQQLAGLLTSFRPLFVRGYPSALHLFSQWVDQNDVPIPFPEAVFTSAEPLFPHMRKSIGDVFNCEVFNTYGLHDGGVSAYECPEHAGLHIDTERSILEVVDQDHRQLVEGEGTILATSLYNYAMPFIRFSTDDEGTLIDAECACGRHSKQLNGVLGRTADILVTPEGKNIHGWFFNHLFYASGHGIKEYQVTQTAIDQLVIKLVLDESFDGTNLETIKKSIAAKSAGWNVQFKEVDTINRTRAGKFKFIVNDMVSNAR